MTRRKSDGKSSNEKLATRSDYERGKLDGLAEAVQLLNERGDEILKVRGEGKGYYEVSDEIRAQVDKYQDSAKALWVIYTRRAV